MKPQVLTGLLIGGVIAAGAFLTPGLLRTDSSARTAEQKTEQARRELNTYNFGLSQHVRALDTESLKSADLDALISSDQTRFDALGQKFHQDIQRQQAVNQLGVRAGLPRSTLTARNAGSAGIRAALTELDARVRQNESILTSARNLANEAVQADRESPGAAFVSGAIELTRAGEALAVAQAVRARLDARLADLVNAARELGSIETDRRQYQAFDVRPALEHIATQVSEIETLQAAARQQVESLGAQIASVKAELGSIQSRMQQARADLLTLEGAGFQPGSDSSFESFRQRYESLSSALRDLGEQEQRLTHGGLSGAQPADGGDEDSLTGGEPVIGLEELERRLAAAEDAAKRLERGRTALQQQAEGLRAEEAAARQTESQLAERSRKQLSTVEQVRGEVLALAEEALKREDDALQAARAAERAFGDSARAQASLASAATKARSELDPTGKNDRLRRITADTLGRQFPEGAEAQARVLAGRVLALRVASIEHLVSAARRVGEFAPSVAFETKELERVLGEAREAGNESLSKAAQWYARVGESGATGWIYLASAAYAHHLIASIDPARRSAALSEAAAAISKAVARREKSPFMAPHLSFLRQMGGAPPTGAPVDDAPAPEDAPEDGSVDG